MTISADALRQVADRIDGFPKFIRRDVGNEPLKSKVERELAALGYAEDPRLVDYVLDLTEGLRLTTHNYFTGQFDE